MSTENLPLPCSSSSGECGMEETITAMLDNCSSCWAPLDASNATFYYCRRCPNLKLCSPCYLIAKHEHIMYKRGEHFVTTEESEDTEIYDGMEGTTVYMKEDMEEPTENIKRCLEILSHTMNCSKDTCEYGPCERMRRVINHTKGCRRQPGQETPCPICKQFVTLTTYHAKSCDYTRCSVPYCNRVKQKLRQKRYNTRSTAVATQ